MDSGMIYHLRHFRCLASFLLFSLNSVTASPSSAVAPSPVQWGYVFLATSPSSPPCPSLHATRWQTAVDHKMVDQRLFPAHPNWRWLGGQPGCRVDPTFYWKHYKIPMLAFFLENKDRRSAPLIPALVPRQDHRGLHTEGWNSCSNEKQQ